MKTYPSVVALSRSSVSEILAAAVQVRILAHSETSKGWEAVKAMATADSIGLLTWWKNESVKGAFASAKALASALDSGAPEEALKYRGAFVVSLSAEKARKAPSKARKAPKAKAPKASA